MNKFPLYNSEEGADNFTSFVRGLYPLLGGREDG